MKLKLAHTKGFASDNWSGVSPEVMEALQQANQLHHPAYGENDPLMEQAEKRFQQVFETDCKVFFVYNGTGANVLAVQHLLKSWQAVVAPHSAHLNEDEGGAPEKFTGGKILTVDCPDGKIRPEQLEPFLSSIGFQHHVQPKLISISQVTEMGSLYSLSAIKALADFAHQHGMYLHMDGARIANAAVALGVSFSEMVTQTGVDVLSFGGTKNGLMFGEAVVFLKPELAEGFQYNRKQGMQLASKLRFITAQFLAYLEDDLWKRNATQANAMARLLADELEQVNGISLSRAVEANGVFAVMPEKLIAQLQKEYFFHVWNESNNEVRLMCSFDTTAEDVQGFVAAAKRLMR
ncbi:MAG: low specificity L-threonine aldolase [Bacteroidetes bacterium]|nr:low specificity L-threonine aldolase [Bacteroidota bacterium]MBU1580450.1 low specificity L-threonine aldolase [Bacteroidota bacterium]MBU2465092.1 low specificity L-threonine aldolase [Bacteroidota bacterium]MBU2558798.1 low specificity L-threonine aldolase [Bacteroidota bacterium]